MFHSPSTHQSSDQLFSHIPQQSSCKEIIIIILPDSLLDDESEGFTNQVCHRPQIKPTRVDVRYLISPTSCLLASNFTFQSLTSTSFVMICSETVIEVNSSIPEEKQRSWTVYLLSDEGENCLFFCLTDADGIQDLASCFHHFTVCGHALQFARILILLRAQRLHLRFQPTFLQMRFVFLFETVTSSDMI